MGIYCGRVSLPHPQPSLEALAGQGSLSPSQSTWAPGSVGRARLASLIQWLAAGLRGHHEDSHCCKLWTLLTLASGLYQLSF